MNKLLIIFIFVILFSSISYAIPKSSMDGIHVYTKSIESFGGLEYKDHIFVGSILKYNITLRSEKELHDVLLGLVIEDPNGDIIHEKEYSFDEILVDEKISLTSETENGEWDLIYLTTPGTYTLSLNLSNPPEVDLFVQETYAYRHDTWLPFYFEVLTSQDRIIMQQNEDMMRATKNTFIASLVMLFVSLTALVSTKSGRRSLSVLITFGILLLIILSIGYLLYLGHLGAI